MRQQWLASQYSRSVGPADAKLISAMHLDRSEGMRGKNERARGSLMERLELDLGEVLNEIQHAALLVEEDHVRAREARPLRNTAEVIQPHSGFRYGAKGFYKNRKRHVNRIDKFQPGTDKCFTAAIADA
jgi:hypothetical protein